MWSLGTLGLAERHLLDALMDEALQRGLNEFTPQAISNFAWAFAQLSYSHQPALQVHEAKQPVSSVGRVKLEVLASSR